MLPSGSELSLCPGVLGMLIAPCVPTLLPQFSWKWKTSPGLPLGLDAVSPFSALLPQDRCIPCSGICPASTFPPCAFAGHWFPRQASVLSIS